MWGRSEQNRKPDAPQGTGQLPARELAGWPHVDAEGSGRGTTARLSTNASQRGGLPPTPALWGRGAFGWISPVSEAEFGAKRGGGRETHQILGFALGTDP